MDQSANKKILEEIACKICMETFNEQSHLPRICTSCGVSICQDCLNQMIAKNITENISELKCAYCQIKHVIIDKNVVNFPLNKNLLRVLKGFTKQSPCKCIIHPSQYCSYYCFDPKCESKRGIACGLCISTEHSDCLPENVWSLDDIKDNIKDYHPPFSIGEWKIKNHEAITKFTKKLSNDLKKIVDNFADFFKSKTDTLSNFTFDIVNEADPITKIKRDNLQENIFSIESGFDEYFKELSKDISQCFVGEKLFDQFRLVQNQTIVNFCRKIFNDPVDTKLKCQKTLSKIKNINWFVQQKVFLPKLDLSEITSVYELRNKIKFQFERENLSKTFTIKTFFSKLKIERNCFEKICFEAISEYGADISQIQYKIEEELDEITNIDGRKFKCFIQPNVCIEEEENIVDFVMCSFRELQFKIIRVK